MFHIRSDDSSSLNIVSDADYDSLVAVDPQTDSFMHWVIPSFLKQMRMISVELGLRIMLIQLGCGFLSGISITFLKDAYGPFVGVISLGRLIVAAFIPPAEDI